MWCASNEQPVVGSDPFVVRYGFAPIGWFVVIEPSLSETAVALQLFPAEGREAITVVVLVTLLIGIGAIYVGIRTKRRADWLGGLPVATPGDGAVGPVEMSGTARPADDQLESPSGEGEVIAYSTKTRVVETRRTDDDSESSTDVGNYEQSTRRSSSQDAAPFYLEDGDGRALIEADADAELVLPKVDTVTEVDDDPDHVDVREQETTKRIWALADGDDVFVFGRARSGDDDATVLGPDDDAGELIVSTKDRASLMERYTTKAPIAMGVGALVAIASAGLLLAEYLIL